MNIKGFALTNFGMAQRESVGGMPTGVRVSVGNNLAGAQVSVSRGDRNADGDMFIRSSVLRNSNCRSSQLARILNNEPSRIRYLERKHANLREVGERWAPIRDAGIERHYERAQARLENPHNAEIEELLNQLIRTNSGRSDSMIRSFALGYGDMRQSFEEQYSGEELEYRLDMLSQAFERSTEKIADIVIINLNGALKLQDIRWASRDAMNYAKGHIDLSGNEEFDKEKFARMAERLIPIVEEAVHAFAQLARQFIHENGAANSEHEKGLLDAFLRAAERPEGSLTLGDLDIHGDSGIIGQIWRGELEQAMRLSEAE